jgi:hypothetical protein
MVTCVPRGECSMYKITEYINFNSGYITFGFTAGRYERRSAKGGKI